MPARGCLSSIGCVLVTTLAMFSVRAAEDELRCQALPKFAGVNLAYKKILLRGFQDINITAESGTVALGMVGNYSCDVGAVMFVDTDDEIVPFFAVICAKDGRNPKRANFTTYKAEYPFGYLPDRLVCINTSDLYHSPPPPGYGGYGGYGSYGGYGGEDNLPYPPAYPPNPPAPPKSHCKGRSKPCGQSACCAATDSCSPDGKAGKGMCCPDNGKVCGSNTCCDDNPDITCYPDLNYGSGLCCSDGTFGCHNQCCTNKVQVCLKGPQIPLTPPETCCDKDKVCGALCCKKGEECVEGSEGVKICCAVGTSPCGRGGKDRTCCNDKTEFCLYGGGFPLDTGLCCTKGHTACGDPAATFCCSPKQTCVLTANWGLAECCKIGLECYHGCCKEGDTCKEQVPNLPRTSVCCNEDGNCYRPLFGTEAPV